MWFRGLSRESPVCIIESEKDSRLKSVFIKANEAPRQVKIIQNLSKNRQDQSPVNQQINMIYKAINDQFNMISRKNVALENIKALNRSISQVQNEGSAS